MNKTGWAMVISGAVLALLWVIMVVPSSQGYGYAGYHGYRGGSSFFYYGSSRPYFAGASARSGSVGGPNVAGRGLKGGK